MSQPTHTSALPAPIVSVRGEATLEVDAEIAVIQVNVTTRAGDQDKATAALTDRTARIREIVSDFGPAVERVESTRVSVRPEFDNKKSEHVRRYVGATTTTVTVNDFAALARLMLALGQVRMVAIDGPHWQLRPDSDLFRQARLAAARDAMVRARDYAEAFGGRLVGILEIADQGMSSDVVQPSGGSGKRAMAMAARAAVNEVNESGELELSPSRQRVRGVVEARFVISEPDLDHVDLTPPAAPQEEPDDSDQTPSADETDASEQTSAPSDAAPDETAEYSAADESPWTEED